MNRFDPLDFDLFGLDQPGLDPLESYEKVLINESKNQIKNPLNALNNLGDHKLEIEDPTPNIWEMFSDFDQRFFNGTLVNNGVAVDWSPKMTLCAGLCRWSPRDLSCEIKLSKPLLQLRSRKDLVETLIHEMIHALLFVKQDSDSRESHGPKFHQHMLRINQETALNISVYHTFHDEVRHYQNHVWRCKGICRSRAPYFGWVRRSMNRKPGPADSWWTQHQQTCGGEYEKVSEPEGFAKNKKSKENKSVNKMKDIRGFFTPTKASTDNKPDLNNEQFKVPKIMGFDNSTEGIAKDDLNLPNIIPFSGEGKVLGTNSVNNPQPGKSILLQKFPSTSTNQRVKNSNVTSSIDDKLAMTSSTIKEKKSPIHHLHRSDSDMKSNEKLNLNETVTLSDEDDAEFSWLNDLSDQDLLRISQTDCIVID